MGVQRGTTTLVSRVVYIDIAPVPVGQAWVQAYFISPQYDLSSLSTVELYNIKNDNYTQIKIAGYTQAKIDWQVVSDPAFKVQSGTMIVTDSSTVDIAEVDLTKAWANAQLFGTGLGSLPRDTLARVSYQTYKKLEVVTWDSTTGTQAYWQAIEREDATVVAGLTTIAQYQSSRSLNASTGKDTPTFITATTRVSSQHYYPNTFTIRASGAAQFYRYGSSLYALDIAYFVVTFESIVASQQVIKQVASVTTVTEDLAIVDQAQTFVVGTARCDGEYEGAASPTNWWTTFRLAAANQVQAERRQSPSALYWEICVIAVTFRAATKVIVKPNNAAVMPQRRTRITWEIQPEGIKQQEAYEHRYREIGANWITTGKIDTELNHHEYSVATFSAGKEYEHEIRLWFVGKEEPEEWVHATFDTIRPVITNLFPQEDANIPVGQHMIGAEVYSPSMYECCLTIELADNPEFTNKIVYSTACGMGRLEVNHAFTAAGVMYIRFLATDNQGKIYSTEYAFLVAQYLRFLSAPQVTTKAPSATHVTVRVKNSAAQYTSRVFPEPPDSHVIERLVEIEAGSEGVCKMVADELLRRWSRENKSVSGEVPIIVTLRFKEKVYLDIPTAGIRESMVLQRKAHKVVPEQVTEITLGDIILSDDELLARIIERMTKR